LSVTGYKVYWDTGAGNGEYQLLAETQNLYLLVENSATSLISGG